MNNQPGDRITVGSEEMPEVLRTLAGVLPQFEGEGLESQLQTFDVFLGILSPNLRPQVIALLAEAATRCQPGAARDRINMAVDALNGGGMAAKPYHHADAIRAYQAEHRKAYPHLPESSLPPSDESSSSNIEWPDKRSHPRLLAQLDQIEAEMKKIGYWSDQPPDLQAMVDRGEIRSYLDAPTFELWLQVLFLPRARQAATENSLPRGSSVGEMARRQYDYMDFIPAAQDLLRLLQEFDQMVEEAI